MEINFKSYFPVALLFFGLVGYFAARGSKTQWVRLLDVFAYGPYLIYLSLQTNYTFSTLEKVFLLFLGATTVTYNGRNYLNN
jgi:hypothetical protein